MPVWKGSSALLALALVMMIGAPVNAEGKKEAKGKAHASEYVARDFSHLLGMDGFSDKLLKTHFKLYEGYVKNTNSAANTLARKRAKGMTGPKYAELKRRFGWEWNGMRLHELYFENLGGKGDTAMAPKLAKMVDKHCGGFDALKKDMMTTGGMRGIGWAVLYLDDATGALFTAWIEEHDGGHLAGATPLLVMDVFEHAFITDYNMDRGSYMKAFWNNIDWKAVDARLP